MEQLSRKKMAQAVVKLLAAHAVPDVAAVVAKEVLQRRWTDDVDLLVRDIALALWQQKRHALVTLKSARAVPASLVSDIRKLLKQRLQAITITIDTVIEPTQKGGIIAITPAGVLDVSVAGRLHQLKQL